MAAITRDGYVIGATPSDAEDVNYNNVTSGLDATDVQEAIDEVSTATETNANAIAAIKDGTDIDSFSDVESAISTLQSNFQDGVDDVYNAVVAKGTTPASKSLSDVVQGIADIETATVHTETYTASSRASDLDMGESHEYRYVDTTNVPNSNSGTYTYPSGSTGGTVDMLADNTYRYVNAGNVYTKGKADGIAATKIGTAAAGDVLAGKTFTNSSSVGANGSMVNLSTNSRYQHASNNATPTLIGDAGYFTTVYDNVSKSNLGDYFEIRYNGSKDKNNNTMTNGYMQTNTLLALPSQTKSVTAGTSATTVSPDSNKVLKSVTVNPTPSQEKSITSSRSAQTVTPDSGKLLSKVTVAKYPDASGTYTASSRGSALDMGATNNLRYVNTNGVPNSNSDTYTYPYTSKGDTVDLGATNTYRYVNASNIYTRGKDDGIIMASVKFTLQALNFGPGNVSAPLGYKHYIIIVYNGSTLTCTNSTIKTLVYNDQGIQIYRCTNTGTFTASTNLYYNYSWWAAIVYDIIQ